MKRPTFGNDVTTIPLANIKPVIIDSSKAPDHLEARRLEGVTATGAIYRQRDIFVPVELVDIIGHSRRIGGTVSSMVRCSYQVHVKQNGELVALDVWPTPEYQRSVRPSVIDRVNVAELDTVTLQVHAQTGGITVVPKQMATYFETSLFPALFRAFRALDIKDVAPGTQLSPQQPDLGEIVEVVGQNVKIAVPNRLGDAER